MSPDLGLNQKNVLGDLKDSRTISQIRSPNHGRNDLSDSKSEPWKSGHSDSKSEPWTADYQIRRPNREIVCLPGAKSVPWKRLAPKAEKSAQHCPLYTGWHFAILRCQSLGARVNYFSRWPPPERLTNLICDSKINFGHGNGKIRSRKDPK